MTQRTLQRAANDRAVRRSFNCAPTLALAVSLSASVVPLLTCSSGPTKHARSGASFAATAELVASSSQVVAGETVLAAPASAASATVDKVATGDFTGTGTFKVWWDESYLGVEVVFADNASPSIDSTNLWDDDSIELYIDGDNNKATSYDSFDRQFVIAPGKALWEQRGRTAGVITSATTNGNTITVRYAVPWVNLGITPDANQIIGLDVGVNDDDGGGGRDGQVMAFGNGDNWSNPAPWGNVRLLPAAGGPLPCTGTWNTNTGTPGGAPVSRRSDVTVSKFMDLPFGNPTRIIQDPVNGDLLVLRENGELYRLVVASKTLTKVATPDVFGGNTSGGGGPSETFVRTAGLATNRTGSTIYVVATKPEEAPGFAQDSQAFVYKGTRKPDGSYAFSKFFNTSLYPRAGGTYFTHEWTGITVSPDDTYLYVNAGSRTDHGEVEANKGRDPGLRETPLTARILRFPVSIAVNTVIPNTAEGVAPYLFAEGIRNSFDPEFAPNGDLLAGDNGPDGDYHEELNWVREGAHYGFPYRLGNEDNQMALLKGSYVAQNDHRVTPGLHAWYADASFPSPPSGVTLTDPLINPGSEANQYRASDRSVQRASAQSPPKPFATFTDHGAPLGLLFDRPANNLCASFADRAFIMRFGLSIGSLKDEANGFEQGRDLLLLDLSKSTGEWELGSVRQLVANFQHPVDNVMVNNRIYVADYNNGDSASWSGGRIWEVVLPLSGGVRADMTVPNAPVVSDGTIAVAPSTAASRSVTKVVSGSFTNSATFKTWRDDSYLGVEVQFNDDAAASIDSTNPWDDDSVELYVDANGNRGSSYDSFDRQFVVTVGKPVWEQRGGTAGVITSAASNGNVMTVRYAIPWSNLGITPTAGLRFGLDVGVNDDDGGAARDGQAMSFGTADNWSDPSTWGVLQLQ